MTETINRPLSIALTDEEQKAFADIMARQTKLQAQHAAVTEFLKTVVMTGEARITELKMEGNKLGVDLRKLWDATSKKHGINLDKVNYDLAEDGKSIFPTAVRL